MRYVDLEKNTVYSIKSMREVFEKYNSDKALVFGIYMSVDNKYFRLTRNYDNQGDEYFYSIYPTTEEYVKRVLADNSIDTYIKEFNPKII